MKRVVIVGAGPGGVSAARRLIDRGGVAVTLITRAGRATHLAGTLDVALGAQPAERFATAVAIEGVECVAGDVSSVAADGVTLDGSRIAADAVIAAPGLALDAAAVPSWSRARVAWDPVGAAAIAGDLAAVPGGTLAIAVWSLPFRCPPAPFALAIRLAELHRSTGRFTRLVVATPEPLPLAGVGGDAPGFLMEACAAAGVEMERRFEIDADASVDGVLRSRDGRELPYELALIVPPHRRSPAVAELPGDGPVVPVGADCAVDAGGPWVIGDAAATGLPRAAGIARGQGERAADAVLEALGIAEAPPPAPLEAGCLIAHGGGAMSRIHVRFPPGASDAEVTIEGPSPDLALAAEGERRRFLSAAGAAPE